MMMVYDLFVMECIYTPERIPVGYHHWMWLMNDVKDYKDTIDDTNGMSDEHWNQDAFTSTPFAHFTFNGSYCLYPLRLRAKHLFHGRLMFD